MLEIVFVNLNYFTKFRYDSMNITAFNVKDKNKRTFNKKLKTKKNPKVLTLRKPNICSHHIGKH